MMYDNICPEVALTCLFTLRFSYATEVMCYLRRVLDSISVLETDKR